MRNGSMKQLAAVLALAAIAAGGCASSVPVDIPGLTGPRVTDEEQIAAIMDDVNRGMESRRIYKVLAHVSRSYLDSEGRDYKGLESYLNDIFRRYREIRIDRVRARIAVDGARARVVETFSTFAEPAPGSSAGPLTLQGQVTVYLEKAGDRWLIVEWGHLL